MKRLSAAIGLIVFGIFVVWVYAGNEKNYTVCLENRLTGYI